MLFTFAEPYSEYVISLRTFNEIGDGRPIYETTRTKELDPFEHQGGPTVIPPATVQNAIVLSSSAVVLTWLDPTLPR